MTLDAKRRHLVFWPTAVIGLLLDLASKELVFDWLSGRPEHLRAHPVIDGFFALQADRNPGTFFGLFGGHNDVLIVFTVVMVALIVGMFLAPPREFRPAGRGRLYSLALGLVLAGAAGNLWDRAWLGAVRDFLAASAGSFHWPTFNLADTWLTLGIFTYLVATLRAAREEAARSRTAEKGSPP